MKKNSYIKDCNSNYLYEGDIVYYMVMRCSSSSGNWGKIANKHDGYFRIKGQIVFKNNAFKIIGDKEEIDKLKMPQGKEQWDRNVWHEVIDLSDYVQYEYGKSYPKGYVEKINISKKKKKIVSNRLEALGVQ